MNKPTNNSAKVLNRVGGAHNILIVNWQLDKLFEEFFSHKNYKSWIKDYEKHILNLEKLGTPVIEISEKLQNLTKDKACIDKKSQNLKQTLEQELVSAVKKFVLKLAQTQALFSDGGPGVAYLWLKYQLNQNNTKIVEEYRQVIQKLFLLEAKLTPIIVKISTLPKQIQSKLLHDKELEEFSYWFRTLFEQGKYTLDTRTETVLSKLYSPLFGNWTSLTSQVLVKTQVRVRLDRVNFSLLKSKLPTIVKDSDKNKKCIRIPLSAVSSFYSLHYKYADYVTYLDKQALNTVKKYADFASTELNSISQANAVLLKERGYKDYYEQIAVKDEVSSKAIKALQKSVSKNFDVSCKYYDKLHKATGLDIHYGLRSIRVGKRKLPSLTYKQAVLILKQILSDFDKQALKYFESLLQGHIDVYPKVGKTSGAFSVHFAKKLPNFILLNWGNSLQDLSTLAHEFGHNFHSYLSYLHQNSLQADYSLAIAEFASTFLETLVMHEFISNLESFNDILGWSDEQIEDVRQNYYWDFVFDSVSAVFRQLALFNFEMEFHNAVKDAGFVSQEVINKMFVKHVKSYLGNDVRFLTYHKYAWISWRHLRRPFYVYTYAFGLLAGLGLFEEYVSTKENTGTSMQSAKSRVFTRYKNLLSYGGSKNVVDIFRLESLDVEDESFWNSGISYINDVLEKIVV